MLTWSVETLGKQVDDELDALPADMRARFVYVSGLIEEFGPQRVGMPHVRSLGNKLWEIRVGGRDSIARAIYMIAVERKIIVAHVFIKKTQRTPERALQTAINRLRQARLL